MIPAMVPVLVRLCAVPTMVLTTMFTGPTPLSPSPLMILGPVLNVVLMVVLTVLPLLMTPQLRPPMILLGAFLFPSMFLMARPVSPLPSPLEVTSPLILVMLVGATGSLLRDIFPVPVLWESLFNYYPWVLVVPVLVPMALLTRLRVLVPRTLCTRRLSRFYLDPRWPWCLCGTLGTRVPTLLTRLPATRSTMRLGLGKQWQLLVLDPRWLLVAAREVLL